MRIDDAGPRTWLLAAVALWAACTWVLAAAGLGGKVEPLPEDPALLQPLQQGGGDAVERLGPPGQYAAIVDRALFAPDRKHRPFFLEADGQDDGDAPAGFDVVLTSVLITPDLEMAIVQREEDGVPISFRLGESAPQAPGWTLVAVAPRSATFTGPEGERRLEMRVFDGVGGQPPTRVASESAESVLQAEAPVEAEADADPTPASQAEAIRRRIEERRARLREQQSQPQPPAAARENP